MNKKVFITYSWDDELHKEWVRGLANKLLDNGVEVTLDQYDLTPGQSSTQFMEKSIRDADHTIVILTPAYRKKSHVRKGGVGYEQQIISGEILAGVERKKFIPIIRSGTYEEGDDCAIPSHFNGIITLDFRNDKNYDNSIEELVRTIYAMPKLLKPQLGNRPHFVGQTIDNQQKQFKIRLSKDFKCLDSPVIFTDTLSQIASLRKDNISYKIDYEIDEVSDLYDKYLSLKDMTNISEEDTKIRLETREHLNRIFYRNKGTLYDQLNDTLNSIIDYSFHKHKHIFNYFELSACVSNCFLLFSNNSFSKYSVDKSDFDVYHFKTDWGFRIYIAEDELNKLSKRVGGNNSVYLTRFGGLDIYDLSREVIIENVIPKLAFSFTRDYDMDRVSADSKADYFNLSNFGIGLA